MATFIITALFLLLFHELTSEKTSENSKKSIPQEQDAKKVLRICPLCGEGLVRGQRVKSSIFYGSPDSMMKIYGCPFCHKSDSDRQNLRYCPSCKAILQQDDYVIARVFNRKQKTHVHVLGCTQCRQKEK